MTTSAQIETAWKENIFDHATIQAITGNAYPYDITANLKSTKEALLMFEDAQINFFKYTIQRTREQGELRGAQSGSRFKYIVEVFYYREKDVSESDQHHNTVRDNLETLDGLVLSSLGKTWDSTVDHWEMTGNQVPKLVELDDREVWFGGYQYTAFKHV